MLFKKNSKQKENEYKQVILVRTDLKMNKGKIAAQCSHASVSSVLKSSKLLVDIWKKQGMKKVVLKVSSEKELLTYKRKAALAGFKTSIIKDAGRTQVKPGSLTAVAIGPDVSEKIDKITKDLKIL